MPVFPMDGCRLVAEPPASGGSFVAAAMFTSSYAPLAERLLQSFRRFAVPLCLIEVPAIHRSISRHGVADVAWTKANFIRAMLERFQRPILYLDADCELCEFPQRITGLLNEGCEFAVYNWAADRQTAAYVPANVVMPGPSGAPQKVTDRFYRFASAFTHHDPRQLLCSGAVQLYANTATTRRLLGAWQATVERFEGSADDHCLDFTFNNRGPELADLRYAWLPKAYARYAWWIYVRPVIDHPQFAAPAGHFAPIPVMDGRKQFYPERCQLVHEVPPFPDDCLVDTAERRLVRVENKTLKVAGSVDVDLWLPK